jgi:hypothetical protein
MALMYSLALATTELNLLQQIIMMVPDSSIATTAKEWMISDGIEYARLLNAHVDDYKAYRLSLVEDAAWNVVYGGSRTPPYKAWGTYTLKSIKDKFTGTSYASTCSITAGTRTCVGISNHWIECTQWGEPSSTTGTCYIQSGAFDGPCIFEEYATCTSQYKASLSQEIDAQFKVKVDKFQAAVNKLQGIV